MSEDYGHMGGTENERMVKNHINVGILNSNIKNITFNDTRSLFTTEHLCNRNSSKSENNERFLMTIE